MPSARFGVRHLLLGAAIAGVPVAAALAKLSPGVAISARGHAWGASSTSGPVNIIVSRAQQRIYVFRGGELIGVSSASTGKPGHRTPLGTFTILQKAVHHRSNKYSNAPMPFMQRLTWDGVAIHAGHLPGYPASHGCIRLPWAFAQKLFAATSLGATVQIIEDAPSLPRVEMAAAKPLPKPAPPAPVPAAAPAAVAPPPAAAAPPPVRLAAAEPDRPPRATWKEQSAEDYVTWGSDIRGRTGTN